MEEELFDDDGSTDPPIEKCGKTDQHHPKGPGPCEWPKGHNSPCDPDIWMDLMELETDDEGKPRKIEEICAVCNRLQRPGDVHDPQNDDHPHYHNFKPSKAP